MSFAVANGYPIFTDAWGKPLSDGYIFIGEKGLNPLSNPQAVYWDEALSIPATNIRTTGGYAMKDGSPGQLFTERPYSILVQNKNGATVFCQPDGPEDEEGKDVVLSEAGEEYLLPSSASVGDRLSFVVKNEAPDAKITQPDGVTIIRGLSQRTATGLTGRFVTKPGQSLRLTNVGETYQFLEAEDFSTISIPTLPTALTQAAAWSPNSRYLVATQSASPTVLMYDVGTGTPTLLPELSSGPSGLGRGIAWSPDGQRLSFADSGTPYTTTYDWNDGAPVKLADPAIPLAGIASSVAWSPNGKYLAAAHATSPFVTIYDWSSGTPSKLSDPAALPTGTGNSVAWSPDGRYLAVAHDASPFITIYDWVSGAPVKISNPATLPTGIARGVDWSPDGQYLAVGHDTSPFITIYDWSSGSPVKIANPASLPGGDVQAVTWSPAGRYLALAHEVATPHISIYDWESGSPVKRTTLPGIGFAGTAFSVDWASSSQYLAVTSGTSPYLRVVTAADVLDSAWLIQHVDGPEIQDSDFDNRTP